MINQELLKKIALVLNSKNGFYIEAGANNGIEQSNTLNLEMELNWSGLLIEPSDSAFKQLVINRPNNIKINSALVSFNYTKDKISGDFNSGSLMSKVSPDFIFTNLYSYFKKLARWIKKAEKKVLANTLQSILDHHNITEVDFFSLDVEGYEVEVLKGLNFSLIKPKALLIEVREIMLFELCDLLLLNDYQLILNMSNFNYKNNPNWSGDHQDYLFVRSDYVNQINLLIKSENLLN